jgi:hypothetical protein
MRIPIELLLVGLGIGVAAAAGCNGNVVVDTAGSGGAGGSGGMGGFGGVGGTTSMVGGGGPTTTSTTAVTTGPGQGGGPSVSCGDYCAAIMANCTGQNAQYAYEEACFAVCGAFAPGNISDTEGNTLGCRAYHGGEPAKNDPKTHCIHAGPYGAGVCGSPCESFCAVAMHACTGPNAQFASEGDCLSVCKTMNDGVEYSATVTSGDSLACRLYHAGVASTGPDAAKTHCAHIGPKSDPCQ